MYEYKIKLLKNLNLGENTGATPTSSYYLDFCFSHIMRME